MCEKPLAFSTADAREIVEAANKAGIKHQVGFNYRFAPAIVLAKQMIESGRLGKIFHFRGSYLQDYIISPDYPKVWRLDKSVAGSGSLGDLGAHVIDCARYLVGEIDRVVGMEKTFITERPIAESMTGVSATAQANSPRETVDVDDATHFLGEFKNGALLSIEATRFAAGHRNDMSFEINGSKGSIKFNLERICELQYLSLIHILLLERVCFGKLVPQTEGAAYAAHRLADVRAGEYEGVGPVDGGVYRHHHPDPDLLHLHAALPGSWLDGRRRKRLKICSRAFGLGLAPGIQIIWA